MSAEFAQACIRFIIGKELANASKKDHGTIYRKLFGLTTAAMQKKRVVLSNSYSGYVEPFGQFKEKSYVCAYAFTEKSTGMEDLIFNAAKDTVMACITTTVSSVAAGASFGTSMVTVGKAYDIAGGIGGANDVKGSLFSGGSNIGSAAYAAGQAVVSASARAGAKGTKHEFSVEVDFALDLGLCAVCSDGGELIIEINRFGSGPAAVTRLMNTLTYSESHGGLRYLRDAAGGTTYKLDTATNKMKRGPNLRGLRPGVTVGWQDF